MYIETRTLTLLALTFGFPTVALAQSGEGDETQPIAKADELQILPQTKFVGAVVTNGEDGADRVLHGSITDLVIDRRNGKVAFAVLAEGASANYGKQVCIPWDKLTWDAKESRFTSTMTATEVADAPVFDREHLDKLPGLNPAGETPGSGRGGTAEASGEHEGGAVDPTSSRKPGESAGAPSKLDKRNAPMLVSGIRTSGMLARQDAFGEISDVYIEPKSGAVAMLAVASGGVLGIGQSTYVIPWCACTVVDAVDPGKKPDFRLDKAKADLESAPKLGDEGADVCDKKCREKIYRFYAVRKPAFESDDQGERRSTVTKK